MSCTLGIKPCFPRLKQANGQTHRWVKRWTDKSSRTERSSSPSWKEKKKERKKDKRKSYIHCLLWACASDYPWSRTLTEHDWSPASRLKYEPKTKFNNKKKTLYVPCLIKSSVRWVINVSHARTLNMYLRLQLLCRALQLSRESSGKTLVKAESDLFLSAL